MQQISKAHSRRWFDGPGFEYRVRRKKQIFVIDVTRSSRQIRGLQLSADIGKLCAWLQGKRKTPGARVLDFGAGAWLRYTRELPKLLKSPEVHFVEYATAFNGDDATKLLGRARKCGRHWTPDEFVYADELKFDLILVVNVLNSIPENNHRKEIFQLLARRLAPLGHLVVLQRIWYASESPEGSFSYSDDGWVIRHGESGVFTYRAGTANTWFNDLGKQKNLRLRPTSVPDTAVAGNTVFKVWERRAI